MNVKRSIVVAGLAAAAMAALVLPSFTPSLSPVPVLFADSLNCNLSQYKAAQGLTAAVEQDLLVVSWAGQNGADLRARYAIDGGQPVIRDLQRVSTPGLRRYVGVGEIPRVRNGLGMAILSTSQGVMSDRQARQARTGGELLALVW